MITGNSTSAESCFLKTCRSVRVEALTGRIGATSMFISLYCTYLRTYMHHCMLCVRYCTYILCVQ